MIIYIHIYINIIINYIIYISITLRFTAMLNNQIALAVLFDYLTWRILF